MRGFPGLFGGQFERLKPWLISSMTGILSSPFDASPSIALSFFIEESSSRWFPRCFRRLSGISSMRGFLWKRIGRGKQGYDVKILGRENTSTIHFNAVSHTKSETKQHERKRDRIYPNGYSVRRFFPKRKTPHVLIQSEPKTKQIVTFLPGFCRASAATFVLLLTIGSFYNFTVFSYY